MSTTIKPAQLTNEISNANAVSTPTPAIQPTAAAEVAVATGITNVSGPNSTVSAAGAVAQNVLPVNERQAAAFGAQLSPQLAAQGQAFAQEIVSNPSSPDLQAKWADYVSQVNTGSGMDVNGLVQWVLREAYMQNTEDLQFYAEKVKFYNELKSQIRDELTSARKALADSSAGASAWVAGDKNNREMGQYPVDYNTTEFGTAPNFDADGQPQIQTASGKLDPATREGLETYIKGLEEKLSSVGDDAQLANVDLQNTLQKQQQTLQMMSNISKMLNDTAMAIIRKIG